MADLRFSTIHKYSARLYENDITRIMPRKRKSAPTEGSQRAPGTAICSNRAVPYSIYRRTRYRRRRKIPLTDRGYRSCRGTELCVSLSFPYAYLAGTALRVTYLDIKHIFSVTASGGASYTKARAGKFAREQIRLVIRSTTVFSEAFMPHTKPVCRVRFRDPCAVHGVSAYSAVLAEDVSVPVGEISFFTGGTVIFFYIRGMVVVGNEADFVAVRGR